MDFATRNDYRTTVEQLARGSLLSELEVANRAVAAAAENQGRSSDPG
jgi:cyclic beta-1,2-glucan synthetase